MGVSSKNQRSAIKLRGRMDFGEMDFCRDKSILWQIGKLWIKINIQSGEMWVILINILSLATIKNKAKNI